MDTAPPVKKPVYLNTGSTAICQPQPSAIARRRELFSVPHSRWRAAAVTVTPAASTRNAAQPPPAT